jgi:hypothetical protein
MTPAVMFTTPDDRILLLRQEDGLWAFPDADAFDYRGDLWDWTEGVLRADVETAFVPELPDSDFQWLHRSFPPTCERDAMHPTVPLACRAFDGPLLDQIVERINGFC